jgi:hypothetical protein
VLSGVERFVERCGENLPLCPRACSDDRYAANTLLTLRALVRSRPSGGDVQAAVAAVASSANAGDRPDDVPAEPAAASRADAIACCE